MDPAENQTRVMQGRNLQGSAARDAQLYGLRAML